MRISDLISSLDRLRQTHGDLIVGVAAPKTRRPKAGDRVHQLLLGALLIDETAEGPILTLSDDGQPMAVIYRAR